MIPQVEYLDLGTIDYEKCWSRQKELFEELVSAKGAAKGDSAKAGWLILCEHPHVYTLGRNGDAGNLLIEGDFLKKIGASYYHTDRGGDITYHGPGQIVGYPILDLEIMGMGLKSYIDAIEQSVIETIAHFGITAGRSKGKGKAGVWLNDCGEERKICAIGVRSSRFITMHGFALNVATELKYFDHINPCGFADGKVTSMNAQSGKNTDIELVKELLRARLEKNMNCKI